jgi:hypothetical protein
MSQDAAEIPVHNLQRKSAIANGGVRDHAGTVEVRALPGFDLNRTIFNTLEGALPRFVIKTRIAKEHAWPEDTRATVEGEYAATHLSRPLPEVSTELLSFLGTECDFDVEHADGSFLDHLYFCYEYTHAHLPGRSPLVMLLHSILGTGTNTFAMTADKIPQLKDLMDDFDWRHVEAFPSMLRLLYGPSLRRDLWANRHRLEALEALTLYRVIDNAELTLNAEDFWIQLNYQMIHLVDFLPVSNWDAHGNDTAFIVFRDLYRFLKETGTLEATLDYTPATSGAPVLGEPRTLGARLVDWLPTGLSEKMAAKSVERFSERMGHSMEYRLHWTAED